MSSEAVRRFMPFALVLLVFGLGVAGDEFFTRIWPSKLLLFADDLVTAIFVGWIVLVYQRHKNSYVEARLRVIRDMNHHVRNALQVLSYGTMKQEDEHTRNAMQESVMRIDWALREILPSDDSSPMPPKRQTQRIEPLRPDSQPKAG